MFNCNQSTKKSSEMSQSQSDTDNQQEELLNTATNRHQGVTNTQPLQWTNNSQQGTTSAVTTNQPQHNQNPLEPSLNCISNGCSVIQPGNSPPVSQQDNKILELPNFLDLSCLSVPARSETLPPVTDWQKEYPYLFKRLKMSFPEGENQGSQSQGINAVKSGMSGMTIKIEALSQEDQEIASGISSKDVFITQPTSPVTTAKPLISSCPSARAASGIHVPPPAAQSSSDSNIPNFVNENLAVVKNKAQQLESSLDNKATHDEDWQALKVGVRERNAAMCNNDLMADILFVVSNNGGPSKTFPAHKYVLATGSSVFFAMFFGRLAETGEEIIVPDVEPDAFLKMLKYLYSDEIDLDEESVLPTLHVAKKYIVPHLAKACVQYMEASLTARNACVLLCQSRIFDEPDLMQRCWEVIDAQAEIALNSEGFTDIDYSTLSSILSRETLNCKELYVFNAAIAWAIAECERREIDSLRSENLRAVLGEALKLIRVPTMDLHEFADGPAQLEIFSLKECHDMFLYFTASTKPKLEYPITPRAGLKPQVVHRFQSSAFRSNQWRYRGRTDSIQFCVDRRIFIVGFGLYGGSTGATTYGVHISLKRQGTILAENDESFFSDGSSNTFHVYFRQPVQIDPDCYYTASAILDGMDLSYFGQEGMSDVTVGNVTFQFQCSSDSTNGTGVQGGQIPDLIFYGPSPPIGDTA